MTMISTCVARSSSARMTLRRAASLMPKMLMVTRKAMVTMPPMELYGQSRRMGQNTAR